MREILFRAKTHKGVWAYGSLVISYGWRVIEGKRQLDHFICDVNNESAIVDPTTVGQYTGLVDKNGEKIFEGDIVKTDKFNSPNKLYVIKFDLLLGAFIGEDVNTMYFTTFDGDSDYFEVIGNIHDNPKLLKGGAE